MAESDRLHKEYKDQLAAAADLSYRASLAAERARKLEHFGIRAEAEAAARQAQL